VAGAAKGTVVEGCYFQLGREEGGPHEVSWREVAWTSNKGSSTISSQRLVEGTITVPSVTGLTQQGSRRDPLALRR
jgi:hypothetical protein